MTRIATRSGWKPILVLTTVCLLLPASASAHPGSGIVVDRSGNVYVVDMVSGVWKLDVHGALIHMPGPGFHWMTLDADDRFGTIQLPSGSGGDIAGPCGRRHADQSTPDRGARGVCSGGASGTDA